MPGRNRPTTRAAPTRAGAPSLARKPGRRYCHHAPENTSPATPTTIQPSARRGGERPPRRAGDRPLATDESTRSRAPLPSGMASAKTMPKVYANASTPTLTAPSIAIGFWSIRHRPGDEPRNASYGRERHRRECGPPRVRCEDAPGCPGLTRTPIPGTACARNDRHERSGGVRMVAPSEWLVQATASEAHAAAKSSNPAGDCDAYPGIPGQSEKPTHDRAACLDRRQASFRVHARRRRRWRANRSERRAVFCANHGQWLSVNYRAIHRLHRCLQRSSSATENRSN